MSEQTKNATAENNAASNAADAASEQKARDSQRRTAVVLSDAMFGDDFGSIAIDAVRTLAKQINKSYAKDMRSLKDVDRKADAAENVRRNTLRRTVAGIEMLQQAMADKLAELRDILTLLDSGKNAGRRTLYIDHAYRVLALTTSRAEMEAVCKADAAAIGKAQTADGAATADGDEQGD